MEVPVYNINGEELEKIKIPEEIENYKISIPLLHEVITAYLSNQRKGTASTKTRGEVSGGGRKPWRQKHTGRARHGSIRSPLWRKGGVVFGPKPRSYRINVPKKKKRKALKMAIASKLKDNEIIILDNLSLTSHKTKEMKKIMEKMNIPENSLIITDEINNNLKLASRNLNINIKLFQHLNAFEVLKSKKMLFVKNAFDGMLKWWTSH